MAHFFALPLVATIAALAFFFSPWAVSQSAEFRGKLNSRKDAGQISPGAFQESSAGDRVIFVEGVAEDTNIVRNVFVSEGRPERLGVTMAGSGHQEVAENGDRFIVLQNGRRYDFQPGTADFRILEYARYAVRLGDQGVARFGADTEDHAHPGPAAGRYSPASR